MGCTSRTKSTWRLGAAANATGNATKPAALAAASILVTEDAFMIWMNLMVFRIADCSFQPSRFSRGDFVGRPLPLLGPYDPGEFAIRKTGQKLKLDLPTSSAGTDSLAKIESVLCERERECSAAVPIQIRDLTRKWVGIFCGNHEKYPSIFPPRLVVRRRSRSEGPEHNDHHSKSAG